MNKMVLIVGFCVIVFCVFIPFTLQGFFFKRTTRSYSGPPYTRKMYEALDLYGQDVAKKNDMEFLATGFITDSVRTKFTLGFMCSKKMTLEESKKFGVPILKNFWEMLQKNPAVLEDMRMSNKEHRSDYPTSELKLERVGLKIAFWDESVDRPKAPYISQILFQNETFYHFEAEPETQALRLVFSEPYKKALAQL